MTFNLFIKGKPKTSLLILKSISFILFLTSLTTVFADESLISVVISRNGNVSYVNLAPLHYEAKKEGLDPIQISQGNSSDKRKPGELRPMELIIYSTCNRGEPKKEAALGFRAQFLMVNLLMSPHPDDLPATHYLTPTGLFRMLKEAVRGHPYIHEEGTIKIAGASNKIWKVNIQRTDTTAVNSKTDYFINFSKDTDQPLFIQALKSEAKPTQNKVPQVTVLLESLNLHVRATYALIHKGARQYQTIKTMNIIDWWSKQQKWCPEK